MTESMIESVARAIAGSCDDGLNFLEYLDDARAVLEAMREPTDAMVDAMRDNIGPLVEMWRGAISAALNEQVSG